MVVERGSLTSVFMVPLEREGTPTLLLRDEAIVKYLRGSCSVLTFESAGSTAAGLYAGGVGGFMGLMRCGWTIDPPREVRFVPDDMGDLEVERVGGSKVPATLFAASVVL